MSQWWVHSFRNYEHDQEPRSWFIQSPQVDLLPKLKSEIFNGVLYDYDAADKNELSLLADEVSVRAYTWDLDD